MFNNKIFYIKISLLSIIYSYFIMNYYKMINDNKNLNEKVKELEQKIININKKINDL